MNWPACLISKPILKAQMDCSHSNLHNKRVVLPQDWSGIQIWPPVHCLGAPIRLPLHHNVIYDAIICYNSVLFYFVHKNKRHPKFQFDHDMSSVTSCPQLNFGNKAERAGDINDISGH